MKILFVWPETPDTFWSYKNALRFISKRSTEPPLGLITVAALLPVQWEKRLVDMNVTALADRDIVWADYVFIGGMEVQVDSFRAVASRCKALGAATVGGGPLCTTRYQELENIDHFVLNEAELTLPMFIADLKTGRPAPLYSTDEFADVSTTPAPLWHLLDMGKYATMDVQYSRGCPYNCEFCSITALYGRKPRSKSTEQFLRELEGLYLTGWRDSVFVVDDNFIGNRRRLREDLLPSMVEWSEMRGHPFYFTTEVSIELADDEELMALMAKAGFNLLFVGIETPAEDSLAECNKVQNRGRDMLSSVRKLQRGGFEVSAGFIVGFDNDRPDIFDRQIDFIQKSGIATAMVGLLNAPKGTLLYKRLLSEKRILDHWTGNNVDASLNFVPKMDSTILLDGYRRILKTIYSPRAYAERIITFLKEFRPLRLGETKVSSRDLKALFRAVWRLGLVEPGKRSFWRVVIFAMRNFPKKLPQAVTMAVRGFHHRKVAAEL